MAFPTTPAVGHTKAASAYRAGTERAPTNTATSATTSSVASADRTWFEMDAYASYPVKDFAFVRFNNDPDGIMLVPRSVYDRARHNRKLEAVCWKPATGTELDKAFCRHKLSAFVISPLDDDDEETLAHERTLVERHAKRTHTSASDKDEPITSTKRRRLQFDDDSHLDDAAGSASPQKWARRGSFTPSPSASPTKRAALNADSYASVVPSSSHKLMPTLRGVVSPPTSPVKTAVSRPLQHAASASSTLASSPAAAAVAAATTTTTTATIGTTSVPDTPVVVVKQEPVNMASDVDKHGLDELARAACSQVPHTTTASSPSNLSSVAAGKMPASST